MLKKYIFTLSVISFLGGCNDSVIQPASLTTTGNAIELQVKPEWQEEFRRGLPEILIFDADRVCQYHSSGFSKDAFANDLKKIFLDEAPEIDVEKFIKEHPELVAKITATINSAMQDATEEARLSAIDENIANVAQQSQVHLQRSLSTCTSSISQHLSLIEDLNGNAILPEQLVDIKTPVIIEYWAEWCLPCKQQRKVLDKFIDEHKIAVTFFHVERDSRKRATP